jgi:hypothetical protein
MLNLRHLDLSNNQLNGAIPTQLSNLLYLERLYLNANQLTGGIPTWLGNLTALTDLDLASNSLGGAIPAQLSNLTNLRLLSLSNAQLTGDLPAWLGGLTKLERLALAGNQLMGVTPAEFASLVNLVELSLNDNLLTGGLPGQLGALANLQTLSLAGNAITGNIPAELGNLSSLQTLYLDRTLLDGALPATLAQLSGIQVFWFNNTQLCVPPDPTVVNWLATISDVQSSGVNCIDLTPPVPVVETPTVDSVFPPTGSSNGSLTVTIRGAYFAAAPVVYLSGANGRIDLTAVTLISSNEVQAQVPAGLPAGAYAIVVCNGAQCGSLPDAFVIANDSSATGLLFLPVIQYIPPAPPSASATACQQRLRAGRRGRVAGSGQRPGGADHLPLHI